MGAHRFVGHDGVELAWHEVGVGRPFILLPGFGGVGSLMLEYGPAGVLAEHGHRVVLPDTRGSGDSARPRDVAGYPADVLADDGFALIEHLGLGEGEYDLGGYSLGARIVVRMLARGAEPGRAVVAGQGLAKVSGVQGGGANHRVLTALVDGTAIEPDSADARTAQAISRGGSDPQALLHVMNSLVPTSEADLRRITVPTLVAIGDRDERSDADELAALMRNARFIRVPGDHASAFVAPELATALVEFLDVEDSGRPLG
ncbi:alpha/beta fold hydrolase [Nocardia alni]|uniref:alpha/beta fold hydrolase n=1 Tax=Nocardia alni TaxID=2815723 RepID=UPI002111217A|nr:alpha/beta fold hydrolase [Nocardia alni]